MDFKTKRRYKFLLRFFAVLMFTSMAIGLVTCVYALTSKSVTIVEMAHTIPLMVSVIITMIISYSLHSRFLYKREAYLRSIKSLREGHWKNIIMRLADDKKIKEATSLFEKMKFSDHNSNYLYGYLSAMTEIYSETK